MTRHSLLAYGTTHMCTHEPIRVPQTALNVGMMTSWASEALVPELQQQRLLRHRARSGGLRWPATPERR